MSNHSFPLATLSLMLATACGSPSARPVLPSPVGDMPAPSGGPTCPADSEGLRLQGRVRDGLMETDSVTFRCAPDDADGGSATGSDVTEALRTLMARLAFLGAPPERATLLTDTLQAAVPPRPRRDYTALAARGALSVHEVNEVFLSAVGQQPLPPALHDWGVTWHSAEGQLEVPAYVPGHRSAATLDAHLPVPGGQWVVMAATDPDDRTMLALPVHAAGLNADDVQPCAARLDDGERGSLPGTRLTMTARGVQRLADLTERAQGHRVVVALDGVGLSAPVVQEPVRGGAVTIAGPGAAFGRVSLAAFQRPLPAGVRCELSAVR
jgi:hypothetical protein